MKNVRVENELHVELGRKSFHFFIVFIMATLFHFFEFSIIPFLVLLLVFGIVISELAIRGYKIPLIYESLIFFDRPENILFRPGLGVFTLISGILFTIVVGDFLGVSKKLIEFAILINLADVFSTLFGVAFGRKKWTHNPRKSLLGSFSFLIFALILAFFYFSWNLYLLLPFVGAFVESLPKLDDNVFISISILLVGCLIKLI